MERHEHYDDFTQLRSRVAPALSWHGKGPRPRVNRSALAQPSSPPRPLAWLTKYSSSSPPSSSWSPCEPLSEYHSPPPLPVSRAIRFVFLSHAPLCLPPSFLAFFLPSVFLCLLQMNGECADSAIFPLWRIFGLRVTWRHTCTTKACAENDKKDE